MIVIYCPGCGFKIVRQEYDNPKLCYCSQCGQGWQMLERPSTAASRKAEQEKLKIEPNTW